MLDAETIAQSACHLKARQKTCIRRFNRTSPQTFQYRRRQNKAVSETPSNSCKFAPHPLKREKTRRDGNVLCVRVYVCVCVSVCFLPLRVECLISTSAEKSGDSQGEKHKTSREFRPQCMKRIRAPWMSSFCSGKARFFTPPPRVCVRVARLFENKSIKLTNLASPFLLLQLR